MTRSAMVLFHARGSALPQVENSRDASCGAATTKKARHFGGFIFAFNGMPGAA
jgi:hypothetical protein